MGLRKLIVIVLGVILIIGCTAKPEPLRFGKDGCYTCKMTLMDSKFGSEIVTKKGKVYKFDDLNCMLGFYHSGQEAVEDIAFLQVINFTNPGELIDARNAWYFKSEEIRTPMASSIAAFQDEVSFQKFKKEWNGIILSWGEVVTQFK